MPSADNALCASVMPRSVDELREQLALCAAAHIVELRLDLLPSPDFTAIKTLVQKPCIVALRTAEEGGFSKCPPAEIAQLLRDADRAGVEFLDVAWRYADDILPHLAECKAGIVLSHHTTERSPGQLLQIARDMMNTKATVYKLVFTAIAPNDTTTTLQLCRTFASNNKRFVVHAMGEAGTTSRLINSVRGNAWTYTSISKDTATAAGQITLGEAILHDIPHKMQGAFLLGLLGYPTAHSRGKILHNALLARYFPNTPVPWLYLDAPTPDAADFSTTWRHLFRGMSVTLPHKENITAFLDDCSDDVQRSGVCNTLVRRGDTWIGFNTDMTALRTLLTPHRNLLYNGALVVGTGGTARSALAVLQQLGVKNIACTGRNNSRGELLATHFGVEFVSDSELDNRSFGAVLQTTSVGMTPHNEELPPAARILRPGMLALDVVYTPPDTPFLAVAAQRRCTIVPGVEMFILQAAEQFRLFTGIDISESDVRDVWNTLYTQQSGERQHRVQREMRAATATERPPEDRSAYQTSMQIPTGTVRGTVVAPASKSITHRLLLLGASADGALHIERPLWSEDTIVTADALEALGYDVQRSDDRIIINERISHPENCAIDLRNSGTSARFLAALAATEEGTTTQLDGSARMRQRPMREIIDALRLLGADIDDTNGGLPLRIRGRKLRGGDIQLEASRSSQFLSALLLIAPRIEGVLRIFLTGQVVSEPYIAMTMNMMRAAGIGVQRESNCIEVETGRLYNGGVYDVEGDYSGAAFLLAAAAISEGEITVQNLASPSLQGDAAIVEILETFGAHIECKDSEVQLVGRPLRAVDIDMNHVPDLVPVTAVVCLFADGISRLRNVAHLAFKESDRLHALIDNAARLGGRMYRENDDLVIEPRPLHGGRIDPYDDHRIAMSFAIAGFRVDSVEIAQPECVEKSYPNFWSTLYSVVR